MELNQHYRSDAVLDDGEGPFPGGPDPMRLYQPTTRPGARVPHAWVQRDGRSVTTLDLVGQGRFTVLTGIGGTPWREAAAWVSHELGVDVSAVAIGPGCDYEDLYFTWSDLREIEEDGCLLVRPDGHVGWRHRRGVGPERARAELSQALCRILDR